MNTFRCFQHFTKSIYFRLTVEFHLRHSISQRSMYLSETVEMSRQYSLLSVLYVILTMHKWVFHVKFEKNHCGTRTHLNERVSAYEPPQNYAYRKWFSVELKRFLEKRIWLQFRKVDSTKPTTFNRCRANDELIKYEKLNVSQVKCILHIFPLFQFLCL